MAIHIGSLRSEVKEIQDRYPVWTLDNAFVHWFVRAFLVSDDEVAAKAVTGVPHDNGVDAVFIDDDTAKTFILQGKCHLGDKAPSENRADVLAFAKLAQTITSDDGHYADLPPSFAHEIIPGCAALSRKPGTGNYRPPTHFGLINHQRQQR